MDTQANTATQPPELGINSRLRDARKRAGFETATAAAAFLNTIPSTYLAHENGTRGIPLWTISEYAAAFGVSRTWLAFGDDAPTVWPATPSDAFADTPTGRLARCISKVAAVAIEAGRIEGLKEALTICETRAPLFSRLGGVLPSNPIDGCCGAIRARITELEKQ